MRVRSDEGCAEPAAPSNPDAPLYEGRYCLIRPLSGQDVLELYPRRDVAGILSAYRPWFQPGKHDPRLLLERMTWLATLSPAIEFEVLVLHRPSMTPLGFVCLSGIDAINQKAEFSVAFFRGAGSRPALEAMHWVIESVFGRLQLHKLVFLALPGNLSAHRLLANAGVVCEAVMREEIRLADGSRSDLLRYAMFASDWWDSDARKRMQRLVPLSEANLPDSK